MASPQVENGYTKIANELLDAYSAIRLSGEENQVFWTIVRKTYGFNKKEDSISLSQFCLATGLIKQNVCRALSKLIKKNIVIKIDKSNITKYRIQKDYTKWLPLSKLIRLSKLITPIIKIDKESVINIETHKRQRDTKETITKEKKDIYSAKFLQFWDEYPRKDRKKKANKYWGRTNEKQKDELIIASNNYSIRCTEENKGRAYIMLPTTFINPENEIWKDYLQEPEQLDGWAEREMERLKKEGGKG